MGPSKETKWRNKTSPRQVAKAINGPAHRTKGSVIRPIRTGAKYVPTGVLFLGV